MIQEGVVRGSILGTEREVHPITSADFDEALKGFSSSAAEWLQTAKNYARYSNDGGQFDELANYLRKMKLMEQPLVDSLGG